MPTIPTNPRPILLSWSSGKDSAWALHVLGQQSDVQVVGLVTTINEANDRVAMHAVRSELLRRQSDAVGVPLWPVPIPSPCNNDEYEAAMRAVVERAVGRGIEAMAFGDLFLEDVRAYRERMLEGTGLEPLFPIWGHSTDDLARMMVREQLVGHVTCVDPKQLSPSFVGRVFNAGFLDDLPPEVDPCGERGEFHTFACDGPMFRQAVPVRVGETVERGGFYFADLLPA